MAQRPELAGLVFVHGINQDAGDLAGMDARIQAFVHRWALDDRVPGGQWSAKWRSTGSFVHDLETLGRFPTLREWAIRDVASAIDRAAGELADRARTAGRRPVLLVVAHSMGQVLAVQALDRLARATARTHDLPVNLLTVGGPLGNCNPVYDRYLRHGLDGQPWGKDAVPGLPAGVRRWIDVFNPLDPVCCDPLLGSSAPPGSQHEVFRVPGQPPVVPPFDNPIRYHGLYFQHPECGQWARVLLDDLAQEPK